VAVRSKWLWGGIEGGGPNTRYTVPTGYRTIVKCIAVQNTFAGFNRAYIEAYNGATNEGYAIVPLDAPGTLNEAKIVECFLVLSEGWLLKTDALHANVNMWISGAELLL